MRRLLGVAALVPVMFLLAAQPGSATPDAVHQARTTYANPLIGDFGPVFPDPSIIRGRDGYWYAYSTAGVLPTDPGHRHNLPIIRSADLVSWHYVGDVFDESHYPAWLDSRQPLWAPDIRYVDGRYVLYYTAVNSPQAEIPNRSIGVATAPTPSGPWTDLGTPLVAPAWWEPFPGQRALQSIIDPALVATPEGRLFLSYGSYGGGLYIVELARDGLRVAGAPTKIASEYRHEAPYIVRHGPWYYLFASTANCCAGPVSGYSVEVARAADPAGPFVDRLGAPMLGQRPGGTPVLAQNGNAWVGPGHNAVVTDLSGQDYLLYHGYDRAEPFLPAPVPQNRKLLLDRLDWIDGWPVVRGGAGPSGTPQPAPVTGGMADATVPTATVTDAFEDEQLNRDIWASAPGWHIEGEPAGGYLSSGSHRGARTLYARQRPAGDLRIRGAFRLAGDTDSAAGFVLSGRDDDASLRVVLDRSERALVVSVSTRGNHDETTTVPLPAGFRYDDWHELDLELRGNTLDVKLGDSGLAQPLATTRVRPSARFDGGRIGVLSVDGPTAVDDISIAKLYVPVTHRQPDPRPGPLDPAFSDEFDGPTLDSDWQWIRGQAGSLAAGSLVFPLQDRAFGKAANDASLLVRSAPEGPWLAETRLDLPFGDAKPTGLPQAGLIAYVDDDLYVRLMVVAQGPIRRVEFVKETPFDNSLLADGSWLGPPGEQTTLLRIQHSLGSAGEHVLRAGISTNGVDWTWGAAYTLPADATIRLALAAFGGDGTARYDYVRVYR